MILSDVQPEDPEALFLAWPAAAADVRWRLGGGSPSPRLLSELLAEVDRQQVLRDNGGQAMGIVQVCEADRVDGVGYLSFMLPSTLSSEPLVLSFARECLELLGLRKLCIQVDEDVLDVLAGAQPYLRQVGCLVGHTRCAAGRYLDRYVFEFGEEDEP